MTDTWRNTDHRTGSPVLTVRIPLHALRRLRRMAEAERMGPLALAAHLLVTAIAAADEPVEADGYICSRCGETVPGELDRLVEHGVVAHGAEGLGG